MQLGTIKRNIILAVWSLKARNSLIIAILSIFAQEGGNNWLSKKS